MFVTAVEQHTPSAHRIVHDDLAARMLPAPLRWLAWTGRWSWLRRKLEAGSDRRAPGLWGGVLCRKRYARDQVRSALSAGIEQVVMLGAGLDTLAYRTAQPAGVPTFEVDMPENSTLKRNRLRAVFTQIPAGVHLVPVRLESDDLGQALAGAGFRADRPALFVWEAVTQYLTEDAVRRTLAFLATAPPESRLIFTYIRKDFFDGERLYGAPSLWRDFVGRRVWHFAVEPDGVSSLLADHGWTECEQLGPAEYDELYLRPSGRALPATEIERFVLASRRRHSAG
jgi:methyltransferase (TIGR00027 family)